MWLVMCRACGTFVHGKPVDGAVVPIGDACPSCGGTAFEIVDRGEE